MRTRRRSGDDADRLREAYRAADDAGDHVEAERLAWQVVAADPGDHVFWFDLALFAKRRRDWPEALRLNARALEVGPGDVEQNPAGWNLGIAATALGDWEQARRGWRAFGMRVPDGDGPITMRLGMIPVRLNPADTDLGAEPLAIDGVVHATEVVWAERLSPAHARVVNVPSPDSGHRYGDVVLTDGVPHGQRFDGRAWVSVFDELLLLARSAWVTWTVDVEARDASDADALTALAEDRGLAAEDWTANLHLLCRACSEGRPGDEHQHETAWVPSRRFGVAGDADQVRALLGDWAEADGRVVGPVTRSL